MQGICCLRVYSFNLIHIPVLIIEHNIEFISHVADYLVDVGRNAGNKGGETIIQGKPIEVVRAVNCFEFIVDRLLPSDYHGRGIDHCIILLYIKAP